MRIGILGTGAIAAAVVTGIAAQDHKIVVSTRSQARSAALADQFANVTVGDNQAVIDGSDLVLVGLMADVARATLPGLRFRADQGVASMMAGVSLADLSPLVAPAVAEAIVIPFPAIASGGSPVLICPPSHLLAGIFGVANHVFELADETALAAHMAAQAALSPAVKLVAETADWLAHRTGNAPDAERFMRVLIGGALTAAPLDQAGVLARLLADLNTKGGLNAEMRDWMTQGGAFSRLLGGLDRLEKRR